MTTPKFSQPNGERDAFPNNGRSGLTKREYFALHLLSGLNANPEAAGPNDINASWAVQQADDLLEALAK